jgi:D-serine deaminase-like pyridoxal phosphate-dependent protein
VESREAVERWRGTGIGLYVDVNPGMDRTGIPDAPGGLVPQLARAIAESGVELRGLHYYDGHIGGAEDGDAERLAHAGYDRLLRLVGEVERAGVRVPEVITAGTPAFQWAISYEGFRGKSFIHRASPGTIVYGDVTSAGQLPEAWGLRPAALVASTVISHPAPGRITCDAGHKAVSADAGVPTCAVLGRPELKPLKPSEEHLPIAVPDGAERPPVGTVLYLVPRHVCPTVNNFEHAVIVRNGEAAEVERVAARGRELPL